MDDYYQILELKEDCEKDEIKKNYYKLSKKYHPDKYNGNDGKFKEINEAYTILYDDQKRKEYNIRRLFKNIDFTKEELNLLFSYYDHFIQSNEYKLLKLIYKTIPQPLKTALWNKIMKNNKSQISTRFKTINIENLDGDFTINLGVLYQDKIENRLKIIIIESKYGMFPLIIRNYKDIIINNINCTLTIKFFIRDNYNVN
tara:strand:+ start:119 stop:718 length:600 start_codon:yes stop_codon:yes gene_type:complete